MMPVAQEKSEVASIRRQMRQHLSNHFGADLKAFPKRRLPSDRTSKVPRHHIVGAVALMVIALGLAAGSAGDFNLYRLLISYLHDDQMRKQINQVLDQR